MEGAPRMPVSVERTVFGDWVDVGDWQVTL
jgi:hypothetical protein